MLRSTASKVSLIVLFALALGYYDVPATLQKIPFTPVAFTNARVHLGLDLQGGSQLDYKIDLRRVPEKDQKAIVEGVKTVINKRVNSLGVSEPNIYTSTVGNEQHLIVELAGVKDLEQAKKIVGKTIQLEFKEPREKEDPAYKETVKKISDSVFRRISSSKKDIFEEVAQEEAQAAADKVQYSEGSWQFSSEISDKNLHAAVTTGSEKGLVEKVVTGNDGYILKNDQLVPKEGYFIIKKLGTRSTAELPQNEKTVQVSHILIAYRGATKSAETVTRTKDEAKTYAESLLKKLKDGAEFSVLAKENSDEPGAKDSAGKLSTAVKEGGSYVDLFTKAALQLGKKGAYSEVVETEFGFHIIRADDFTQYKYASLFFSTAPDPWQATGLTGEQFQHAEVTFDKFLQPTVSIKFDDAGAKLFEEITGRNVNKQVAIFVGGTLISSPNVNQKISGGNAVITGRFTIDEAQGLARDLNTGAIPAPVVLSGQYTIGATLGETALNKSIYAGLIGVAILALFMILYYRLPGFVAVLALSLYTAILVFLIKSALPLALSLGISVVIFITILYTILKSREGGWEKFITLILACFILFFVTFLLSNAIVLTLAGVAGVILSIGMAVDANILIFERTKEELASGRPLSSAIDVGFSRAWSSIRDSNFSSLITCGILFYFGTSIIQGFAFNLAAGILVSMFTAITVTKTLLNAVIRTKLGEKLWLWGLKKDHNEHKTLHIVEKTKLWFGTSGAVILVSLVALMVYGLKLGIDFKGGTLLDLSFEKAVTAEQLKQELKEIQPLFATAVTTSASSPASGTSLASDTAPLDLTDARVVPVPTGTNQFLINIEHIDSDTHDKLLKTLETKLGAVTENRFTTIGPVVGDTLKQKAVTAVIVAMLAIILYIAFAFRKVPKRVSPWKFGVCAIVALLHDVIIPIGVFAVLRLEVDALFITAILTVLGFSVHDTIVVFDRIRENLKLQARDESFTETANKSMSQTMGRSINTSLATLITLVSLLVFGSPSVFNFILVLVIGISVGTYSSIFIASPLLVLWQKRDEQR